MAFAVTPITYKKSLGCHGKTMTAQRWCIISKNNFTPPSDSTDLRGFFIFIHNSLAAFGTRLYI